MSLTDWQKNGSLIEHWTSGRKIVDLVAAAARDLANSAAEQVSDDIALPSPQSGSI